MILFTDYRRFVPKKILLLPIILQIFPPDLRHGAGKKEVLPLSYRELHPEESQKWDAILCACDRILAGDVDDAFCTSALQGGAGTSTNMNVNEVIANLALTVLGQAPGNYDTIHPLDDVNRGQSF